MDIQELYNLFLQFPNVTTDTRKIKPGDIFFALKGPNFNGNTFIKQALDAGAAYCIADENTITDKRIIKVGNSLEALQALAKHHRQQFTIPFIAITGSNGKTTTKELIHSVLSTTYKTYTTQGNLNNHIGIPLTILAVKEDAEMAVIEMGANHQKEIEHYCRYTLPSHGLITNCGKAHLEGFGSEEGVRKAKGELFDFIREQQGTAFVCSDFDYLVQMSKGIQYIITYGTKDAMYTGYPVQSGEFLSVKLNASTEIKTQLVGNYNFSNVMAAVAVGKTFNVDGHKIKKALEDYEPTNSRSQMLEKNGNRFIMDAYNANPSSMAAAIDNFAGIKAPHKIVIIGAMKELGREERKEHQLLLEKIQSYKWDKVVVVGKEFDKVPQGMLHFQTSDEAKEWILNQNFTNRLILVKGSRGIQLEKVVE